MKYITGAVVLAVLSFSAPLYAQDKTDQTEPQAAQNEAAPVKPVETAHKTTATGSTDAAATDEKKPAAVKKAEAPKKKRKAAKTDSTLTFDGTASTTEPRLAPKKSADGPTRHSGSVPVVHEGGKTCSGQDEYKVCW